MAQYFVSEAGWIKISRRFLEGPLGGDSLAVALLNHLKSRAHLEPATWNDQGKVHLLERGQLVTSAVALADHFGLDRRTIERRLKCLEDVHHISMRRVRNGRLITILDYDETEENGKYIGTAECTSLLSEGCTSLCTHIEEREEKKKKRRGSDFEKSSPAAEGTGEADQPTPGIEETNSSLLVPEASPPLDRVPLPTPRDLVELWNSLRSDLQPKVNLATFKATSSRWTHAQARLLEVPGLPYWREVITKIAESDFCNGKNDRGWTATFDFLVRKETHVKAMEGQYENRRPFNAKPEPRIFTPIVESLEEGE